MVDQSSSVDGVDGQPRAKSAPDLSEDILATSMDSYRFPHGKLKRTLRDGKKTPLVLVACGSFSPPTFLHLRMFELAADYVREKTDFEVVGGYFSPVSDAYKKNGLEKADARVKMCQLATAGSDWLMVDNYEGLSQEYIRTALVLDHFSDNVEDLGVRNEEGEKRPVRVALLAGADLIATFGTPGVWDEKDLDHILGRYGCFILERMGTNVDPALEKLDRWVKNLWFINQPITNDVSSTKIRLFLEKDLSIRYLIPTEVINYIYANGLFNVGRAAPNGHAKRDSQSLRTPEVTPNGNT